MASKKVITLCSSASFYKDVLEIAAQLTKKGYKARVPLTANIMKKTGDFEASKYKTWFTNTSDFKRKTYLMRRHFDKIVSSDAILVVNNPKNGVEGYIGANGLMEMGLAFHLKKKIYVWNSISKSNPVWEEIVGMNSIFVNADVNRIKL